MAESNEPSNRSSALNTRDLQNIGAVVKWMSEGRVDARGLAKRLPNTAKDLWDCTTTPDDVAEDLVAIYEEKRIEYDGKPGIGGDLLVAHFLSNLAAPCVLSDKKFRSAQKEHERESMRADIASDIYILLVQKSTEVRELRGSKTTEVLLKESVDETCRKWSDRLDKTLFRGKKRMFLKKCRLYQVELWRYNEPNMPLGRFRGLGLSERVATIRKVCQSIALGLHEMNPARNTVQTA